MHDICLFDKLDEISNKLNEIFTKYNMEIKHLLSLFETQQLKQVTSLKVGLQQQQQQRSQIKLVTFASRQELLEYQRAILVQKLSTKHYDLLNLLFRNVFDFYQRSCNFDEADEDAADGTEEAFKLNKKNVLIENFEHINKTIFELDLFDHLCGDIVVGVVQNKIRLYIENTSMDNYQESFIKSFELVSRRKNQERLNLSIHSMQFNANCIII